MPLTRIGEAVHVVQFDVSSLAPRREDVRGALFVAVLREEPQELNRIFIDRSDIEERFLTSAC